MRVLTIGHSTRPLVNFVELLWLNGVSFVVDVRSFPRSRFPQFNRASLEKWLPEAGVGYLSLVDLGGKRDPLPASVNTALKLDVFRSVADYLPTEPVQAAFGVLEDIIAQEQVAIMCSEGVPWKCHRLILSDALTVRGYEVVHILDAATTVPHVLSPLARWDGRELTYPGGKS